MTLFAKKLLIPCFKPKNLRNCIWKTTQNPGSVWEGGEIQCYAGKHRSLPDIYNLVNSYFPGTTEEEIKIELARLCYKRYCVGNWCPIIQLFVFYPNSIYDGAVKGNIRGDSALAKELRELQTAHKDEWDAE